MKLRTTLAAFLASLAIASAVQAAVEKTFKLDARQWADQPKNVFLAGEMNGWSRDANPLTDPDGDKIWTTTVKLEDGIYLYKFVVDVGPGNGPDGGVGEGRWLTDLDGDKDLEQPDGYGGMNSGVVVGPDARDFPPPKPNHINDKAVIFRPADLTDFNIVSPTQARLRVRAQQDDVQRVEILAFPSDPNPQQLYKLSTVRGYDIFGGVVNVEKKADFAALVIRCVDQNAKYIIPTSAALGQAADKQLANLFVTPDWAKKAVWYQIFPERFRNGDTTNDPGDKGYDRLVPWNGDWWKDLPGETPPAGPTLELDNFYRGTGDAWNRRYGGDLQGVLEKLPYLRSLGINAIYLNPVFEAESMHKYDTADFRHIDDNFGQQDVPRTIEMGRVWTEANPPAGVVAGATSGVVPSAKRDVIGNRLLFELDGTPMPKDFVETNDPSTWRWTKSDLLFLKLVKEARVQGFRVIVDGVFNHTGRAHPYWKDVLDKGKKSEFADWFEITDWGNETNWKPMEDPYLVHGKPGGIQWKAWDNPNGHLPVFRKDAKTGLVEGPYKHIMDITRRWLDPDGNPQTHDGIDGWRLDVPGDIPHPFWLEWRKVVKASYADAYITGEIWSPAQPWINSGDQFDAVMNYQFAMPGQQFFANQRDALSPSKFSDVLVNLQYMYPLQAALVMQNLYDSHDTDRASSWVVNPDRPYDGQNRPQDNAVSNPYSPDAPNAEQWKRFEQMVAFQMTFLGAPMLYYGTEAGMWSPDDPSNRQPFPWQDKGPYTQTGVGFNQSTFTHYQRFIAIRSALPALEDGFYVPLVKDDASGVLAFAREQPTAKGEGRAYVIVNRSASDRTISVPVKDAEQLVNYADVDSVDVLQPDWLVPDSRPRVRVRENAPKLKVTDGQVTLTVPAWGIAVLAR